MEGYGCLNATKRQNPVLNVRMSREQIDRFYAAVATSRYKSRGDYIMAVIIMLCTSLIPIISSSHPI